MLCMQREALRTGLLEIPALVNRYRDPLSDFPAEVLQWFVRQAAALERLRLPVAATLASLGGRVSALRDCPVEKSRAPRKAVRYEAMHLLVAGEQRLTQSLTAVDDKLEAHRLQIAQIVAAIITHRALPGPAGLERTTWLRTVWAALAGNAATDANLAYLTAALPEVDRLYLLGETMDNFVA